MELMSVQFARWLNNINNIDINVFKQTRFQGFRLVYNYSQWQQIC